MDLCPAPRALTIASLALCVACGVPQEEHDKALADQKAMMDAEMKKMQGEADNAAKRQSNHIGELKSEVEKLGGNLAAVESRAADLNKSLGAQAAKLASTQKNLASTQESLQDTTGKLVDTEGKLQATQTELNQVRKLREQAEAAAKAFENVAARLKSMVDAGQLEVVVRKGRMTLKLPDDILFPVGKTRLKKAGKDALVSVAKVLQTVEGRDFLIAGHTDNVPIKRGRYKSNWDLSTARAVRVVKLMVANGVSAERLAAAGFGEFDPVGDNTTKDGRARNRRLEIILMPKLEELPQLPGSSS